MRLVRINKISDPEELSREGERYEEGGDFRNAFRFLTLAAQLGHIGSQLNLGNYYAWGKGTRRNSRKAAYWYKKAYRNGHSDGAHNLAIDWRNEGNLKSAVVWLKKAIEMNNGDSVIELARIYKVRKGGQKAACKLLKRALRMNRDQISDAGREEAKMLLKQIMT
jgi:TPR repeat protein